MAQIFGLHSPMYLLQPCSTLATLLFMTSVPLYSGKVLILQLIQSCQHRVTIGLPSLVAPISETDYSSGRFQLSLQRDGNLVFYTKQSPSDSVEYYIPAYDATGTFGPDFQLVFNQSGSVYVTGSTDVVVVLQDSTDPALYYQRAILEYDGVFRKYVYQRSSSPSNRMKWMLKAVRPQGICSIVSSGKGVCGLNSICHIQNEQLQRPNCSCAPGYTFLDEKDQMKGCEPNFTLQSCLEDPHDNNNKQQFQLKEIRHMNFPDSSAYEILTPTSEETCHNVCLSDCYCAAVAFQDVNCKKLRFPLSNLWVNQSGDSSTSKAFIKVRIGNSTSDESDQHNTTIQQPIDHRTVILTESVFLGSSVFLNILLLLLLPIFGVTFCSSKRKPETRDDVDISGTNMRNFSYMELEEATNGFKEVVGQGAFATVYKGLIESMEGKFIAVKKLNEMMKENQKEFENEAKAIARTCHRNLVELIGFCNEGQHRLLVYEYMPNGTLADILFRSQRPNLCRRMKFALETAIGLNYLHEECSIQIIHCDIKLQNILLDNSFTGLAKLLNKDQAHTLTGIRGTKGYVAPEWFKSVPITKMVDVYSYGILLLELICCRRCFEGELKVESQMVLADWAYDCYKDGRINKLVEGDNEALADTESIKKLVMISLWCIQEEPSLRPSMNKVVQLIKEALEESLPQHLPSHVSPMSVGFANSPPSSTEDF